MSLVNASDLLTLGTIGPDGAGIARRMFDNVGNSNADVGAVNGTGVTLTGEYTTGIVKSTVIRLASVSITMTDDAANGSIGSLKIYDMPAAAIRILGARTNLTVTAAAGITATATLKHSLGTAAAATTDTLNLLKANIIPSTDTVLSGSAGSPKGISAMTAITALTDSTGGTPSDTLPAVTGSYVEADVETWISSLAAKINNIIAYMTLNGNPINLLINGVSSAPDIYLNFGVADAGSTANSTLTVSGTITIDWLTIASA